MRERKPVEKWVVYNVQLAGELGPNAVCEEGAWEAMARVEPRRYRLVQGGIASEAEAERLARASQG